MRAAVRAWAVPVDPDIAVLLTSDLVTEAIVHGNGQSVTLGIRCLRAALRVDVYHAGPPQLPGTAAPAGATPAGACRPGVSTLGPCLPGPAMGWC